MIVIETPRVFLRHFTLDDVDAVAEVLCDHDNMRFFPNRFERKDAVEWIEKNLRRYAEDGVGGWALILKPDNRLGGHCGLVRREIDGAKEIESNTKSGNPPFSFQIGSRSDDERVKQVIKGWEGGIVGMKVGGKRKLVIPAELAYGKAGNGAIPADADLIFDVELVSVAK